MGTLKQQTSALGFGKGLGMIMVGRIVRTYAIWINTVEAIHDYHSLQELKG